MSGWEDYTYPDSSVLRNKAGLHDAADLQRFERGVTAIRIQQLREKPIEGDYGLGHMKEIHKQIFRDVYEWAGQTRTVDIAKGSGSNKTVFAFKEDIGLKAELVKATIEDANRLKGMGKEQFAGKMAEVYAAVNELHPFREGNGRTAREYMSQLASESGRTLDFSKVDKPMWNTAARQSAHGDLEPIKQVFYEITSVERAVAFDAMQGRAGQQVALAKHPELDGAVKQLVVASRAGGNVEQIRAELSRELHDGKIVVGNVTMEESRRVIDMAAKHRGLMVRDADRLGGQFQGQVVSVSSHHVMLQVGDMVAVRYERSNLDRDVSMGERVTIQYGREQSQVYSTENAPQRERGRDFMQMERERGLATP